MPAIQPYSNLASAYPNLSGATSQVAANIARRLRGELSPETKMALQDSAATFGVASGMPGSGLAANRGARDLGRATEDFQRAGEQDFLQTIGAYSGTLAPTIGQQMQQNQFNADLGFRQGEANRAYGLNRDAADLKAYEVNQRYAPQEYSYSEMRPGEREPQYKYQYWIDRFGRKSNNPMTFGFKYTR